MPGARITVLRTPEQSFEQCHFCRQSPAARRGESRRVSAYGVENNNHPGCPLPPAPLDETHRRMLAMAAREGFGNTWADVKRVYERAAVLFPQATLMEELLVSRFRAFFIVRRMPHHHVKFRGHAIAFMQNVDEVKPQLPRNPRDGQILVFRAPGDGNEECDHADYHVDVSRVAELLRLLRVLYPQPELYGDDEFDAAQRARRAAEVFGSHERGSLYGWLAQKQTDVPGESDVGPTGAPEAPAASAARSPPEAPAASAARSQFTNFDAANMGSSFVPQRPVKTTNAEIAQGKVADLVSDDDEEEEDAGGGGGGSARRPAIDPSPENESRVSALEIFNA